MIRDLCFLAKKHKVNNKVIISEQKNLKSKSILIITNFVDFMGFSPKAAIKRVYCSSYRLFKNTKFMKK